jgi:hypothetical protein
MSIERPASGSEKGRMDLNEALAEIGVLRQRAMQEGAVDAENDFFSQLIIDARNGKVSPEEAVEKARALAESRQNYH